MKLETVGPAMQALTSIGVLVAFFGTVAALIGMSADIPPGVKEVLLVLVGVLAGAFKDVISYWVGSSYGSQRKTDQLANR